MQTEDYLPNSYDNPVYNIDVGPLLQKCTLQRHESYTEIIITKGRENMFRMSFVIMGPSM